MAQSPFEKVRSLVERRKLFESLLQEQSEILCKGEDDSLFHFKPTVLAGDSVMEGWFSAIEKNPVADTQILGNFTVGSEKYFFHAPLKVSGDEGSFEVSCDVFKLQRRASLRLQIPASFGMYLAITEFQGKNIYTIAQIADISAGGARIFFSDAHSTTTASGTSKDPGLRAGDQFKCVLRTNSKRNLDLSAIVKHSQKSVYHEEIIEQFGIEFTDLTPLLQNRLLGMTMDLQQRLVKEV